MTISRQLEPYAKAVDLGQLEDVGSEDAQAMIPTAKPKVRSTLV
jgi:hypothetical protein